LRRDAPYPVVRHQALLACASPGNAGSPYVNASSKAGYKGYN